MISLLQANPSVSGVHRISDVVDRMFVQGVELPAVESDIKSNLAETWESYWLQMALPALEATSLHVEVRGARVLVAGAYRSLGIETATFLRHQTPCGEFYQVFEIPGEVDGDRAETHFQNGVLTLRLPKVSYLKPRILSSN